MVRWHAARATIDAGFWYDDGSLALSVDDAAKLGGPLTAEEIAALGVDNVSHIDNRTDRTSYEYGNADRPSQYYGELRWTTAWPVLQQKFGR